MRSVKLFCTLIALLLGTNINGRTQQVPRLDDLKRQAIGEVDQLQTLTQQMVDEVFSFSELGFQEYETSRYLTAILEKNGFKVERGVAGIPTAWVATWGAGKPVIGFISDIDCIPSSAGP